MSNGKTEIKLRNELPDVARQELIEAGLPDLNIGDIYIDKNDGLLIRINKIIVNEQTGKIESIIYGKDTTWDGQQFTECYGSSYSAVEFKRTIEGNYVRVEGNDVAAWHQKALDVIEGRTSIQQYTDNDTDSVNNETALMSKGSKESLLALQEDLNKKRDNAGVLARFITREMERKKQELDKIRQQMYGIVADFQKKLKKIMRVINSIEIYLGIEEELFCLQEGEKADVNTPITFRQAVLYMDEEIGHWEDGGLDYSDIKWFDEFLLKDDNYKRLFPEEKGMVVFRPRRFAKDYNSKDYEANSRKNQLNLNNTYLLIRNGECLYRVFTERVVILPRLFPKKKELQELFDNIQKAKKQPS